ncbi:hypothetical protein LAZ67_1005065 [Cordylochernes scorpioides]|uniref:Sulfatase N-terminal domain-containing protein n=1 Tax=Cordylochernes scorpioides TaxID=51811 RepID=A0ABY6JXV0_9ARAC|nr:hypothetical protein LAZ67_1005065 [Cordylochernes scorpioides]
MRSRKTFQDLFSLSFQIPALSSKMVYFIIINNPQLIDINLLSMLAHSKDSGVLNRTLLFLFSDHGFRMGPFRQTTKGQLESRLPAGFLMTPPSLLKRWPEAKENLKANEHVLLTTWIFPWEEVRPNQFPLDILNI